MSPYDNVGGAGTGTGRSYGFGPGNGAAGPRHSSGIDWSVMWQGGATLITPPYHCEIQLMVTIITEEAPRPDPTIAATAATTTTIRRCSTGGCLCEGALMRGQGEI